MISLNGIKIALLATVLLAGSLFSEASENAVSPKRVNKVIELLERGQPVYYTYGKGGYEEGKKLAQIWAAAIYWPTFAVSGISTKTD